LHFCRQELEPATHQDGAAEQPSITQNPAVAAPRKSRGRTAVVRSPGNLGCKSFLTTERHITSGWQVVRSVRERRCIGIGLALKYFESYSSKLYSDRLQYRIKDE
jgi:hypothetical protein